MDKTERLEDRGTRPGAYEMKARTRRFRGMRSGTALAVAFALAGSTLVFALTSIPATGLSLPRYVSATPRATTTTSRGSPPTTTSTLPTIRRAVTMGTTTYITMLPKVSVEDDNGRTLEVEGIERGDDPPGRAPAGDR